MNERLKESGYLNFSRLGLKISARDKKLKSESLFSRSFETAIKTMGNQFSLQSYDLKLHREKGKRTTKSKCSVVNKNKAK